MRQRQHGRSLAIRLTFLCHGTTRTMREGGFPAPDDPMDDGGAHKAARAGASPARYDRVVSSPARAARETAAALGLSASVELRLTDRHHGDWTGMTFADADARDPRGFAAWIARPADAAPGGESLQAVCDRVAPWIGEQAERASNVLAVTHPMVIRAALSVCLDLPTESALRFDIAPLSRTILSYNRLWRLRSLSA